jgi:hypothetical protein
VPGSKKEKSRLSMTKLTKREEPKRPEPSLKNSVKGPVSPNQKQKEPKAIESLPMKHERKSK